MAALDRDAILQAEDLRREEVAVPEWGGEVFVRTMTGAERDAFEATLSNGGSMPNMKNIRARLAALTLCDENGERLFSSKDVEELGGKSAAALDRVFAVAQRLNGISQADTEELAKN